MGLGQRAKRHIFGRSFFCQPMRISVPAGENTVMFCLVSSTVQSASQMSPTPMRELVNYVMTYSVVGKSCTSCWIGIDAVAKEDSIWSVEVPIHIYGVVVSRSPCEAESAIYICVTPKYTMTVS